MDQRTPVLCGIVIILLMISCCAGCILTDTPSNETEPSPTDPIAETSVDSGEQRQFNATIQLPVEQITAVLNITRYPHIPKEPVTSEPENVSGEINTTIPEHITQAMMNGAMLVENTSENTSAINDTIELIPEGLPVPSSPIVIPDVFNFSQFTSLCAIDTPMNRIFSFAMKWDKIDIYTLDYEVNETPTIIRSTVKPHTFTEIREGVSDFGKKLNFEHEATYIVSNALYGVGIVDKNTGTVVFNKGMEHFADFEKVGQILITTPGDYQFVCYGRNVDVEISVFAPDLDFEPEVTDGVNYTPIYQAGTIVEDAVGNRGVITQVNTDKDFYNFRTLRQDPNGNYYLMKDATFEEMGRKENAFRIDHIFTKIFQNMSASNRIAVYRPYSELKTVIYGYLSPNTPTTMKFTPK